MNRGWAKRNIETPYLFLAFIFTLIRETSSSNSVPAPGQQPVEMTLNCTSSKGPFPIKGRLYSPKPISMDGSTGAIIGLNTNANGPSSLNSAATGGAPGRTVLIFNQPRSTDLTETNLTLESGGAGEVCGSVDIVKSSADSGGKGCVVFGHITRNDDGKCVKRAAEVFSGEISDRSTPCILVLYVKKEIADPADPAAKWLVDNEETLKDKMLLLVAEPIAGDTEKVSTVRDTISCALPIRASDDDQNQQDSLLNNFSRTSVLFVSVSFIILMVISLAWLVFYYVQRFRYAHAKDRLARRLFNAAKKALTKIPAKTLRQGDKEMDSDCPVCIEPYHTGDVIRILPCKHVFHKTCVDPWLLEHRTCPMCKMDILKAFGYHFGHSEESVRDADQLSAGGQSTDGGSGGTGPGGRSGSGAAHGFPMSLPTESDLHDPFFPSPVPSPSLLQPVLHSSNAQSFTIIPLTVHRQHGAAGSMYGNTRSSDSSADSADNWVTDGAIQRQHSAEVHHGPAISDESQQRTTTCMDDNHNDTKAAKRHSITHHNHNRRNHHRRQSASARPSNVSTLSFSSNSSTSSSSSQHQQRQPLFHSRSAGILRGSGAVNTVDSCDSDDGGAAAIDVRNHPFLSGKRTKQDDQPKLSAIVSRGRSASQTTPSAASKARVAVCTTPPPTAAGQATTTTMVIGRESSSSLLSSASDCVVIGVVNSNSGSRITPTAKITRNKNAVGERPKGTCSLESL